VADVNDKNAQVDAFIGFAEALAADYRQRLGVLAAAPNAARAERQRETLESDRHVLEHTISELKSQKTTYETVERKLKDGRRGLDTSTLARALLGLDKRITRLSALAETMTVQPSQGYSVDG